MNTQIVLSLSTTGFAVAFLHAALPNHWLPFVLAGRSRRWPMSKTLAVTALAGGGHVLITSALGVAIVWLGLAVSKWTAGVFPLIAGGLLIAFGLVYVWLDWRENHGHHHHHHHHGADELIAKAKDAKSDVMLVAGLVVMLTFSPCEGFLPVYLTAATLGWAAFVYLSVVLAAATLAGMMVFTALTIQGLQRLNLHWLEHHEHGVLGAIIALLGVLVILFER